MTSPELFMKRAIELAGQNLRSPAPNPRVGAVIVHRGKVIAEAAHKGPGTKHAEARVIEMAHGRGFRKWKEADLYCTLEPCSHTNKRTPPCAPAVIEKAFRKVYVANKDPNPFVSGRGLQKLRQAGLSVELGLLKKEAEALNQSFFKNQLHQLPYVGVKMALSFDGKMALDNGESQWISSEKSLRQTHLIRNAYQWIAVGRGTVEKDNPRLNIRLGKKTLPSRVLVFGKPQNWKTAQLRKCNESIRLLEEPRPLKALLAELYQEGITEILLEGGPRLISSFLEEGLIDEIHLFYGTGFLGGSSRYSLGEGWALKSLKESVSFRPSESQILGPDLYVRGILNVYRSHPKSR